MTADNARLDWSDPDVRRQLCTGLTGLFAANAPQDALVDDLITNAPLTDEERSAIRAYLGTDKRVRDL